MWFTCGEFYQSLVDDNADTKEEVQLDQFGDMVYNFIVEPADTVDLDRVIAAASFWIVLDVDLPPYLIECIAAQPHNLTPDFIASVQTRYLMPKLAALIVDCVAIATTKHPPVRASSSEARTGGSGCFASTGQSGALTNEVTTPLGLRPPTRKILNTTISRELVARQCCLHGYENFLKNLMPPLLVYKPRLISAKKDSNMIVYAVKGGCVNCLRYIHQLGWNIDYNCGAIASKMGHLDCLQYILMDCEHIFGRNFFWDMIHLAARNGRLECLQLLIKKQPAGIYISDRCRLDTAMAAQGGIEMLTYVHQELGYQLTDATINAAIECDNPTCMQYVLDRLAANKLVFNKRDISIAIATYGSIKCLVHFNDSIYDKMMVTIAVIHNQVDFCKFLVGRGGQYPVDICCTAAREGRIECLILFHKLGAAL
jgi:hypothetical protein